MSSLAAASTRQAFDTVTELTDPGDGTFRGLVSAAWTIGGRPNGRPGPVTVTAEVLRTGRSASQVWARMGQADQACVEALITVGHLDRDTSAHWDVGAPAIPQVAFDDAQTLVARLPTGDPDAIMQQVAVRLDPECTGFTRGQPSGRGELRGWLSLPGNAPFDPISLLCPPGRRVRVLAQTNPTRRTHRGRAHRRDR